MDLLFEWMSSDGWVFLGMVAMRIDFEGLVDLVSDKTTENPATAHLLLPNATQPNTLPSPLAFPTPHLPRLIVVEGEVTDSSGMVPTTSEIDYPGRPAFRLDDRHLDVDWNSGGNLHVRRDGSQKSVDYLAQMDKLVDLMTKDDRTAPGLGGVSPALIDQPVDPVGARIIARFKLTHGQLEASGLWQKKGDPGPTRIFFQLHPATSIPITTYKPFVAESLVFKEEVAGEATLPFVRLSDLSSDAGTLVIAPDSSSGEIVLIVRNTEAGAHVTGPHFVAHYMIRDGWEHILHARFPDTSNWKLAGSFGDPQCSPAENGG